MIRKSDELFSERFSDKRLYYIFYMLFATNVLVNMDHGTIPACIQEVKTSYSINNMQLGSLGTVVYAGLSLGSAIGTKLFKKTDTIKYILTLSLASNAICLIFFALNKNYTIGMFLRLLSGFFQVFTIIITPVWADAFGS